MIQTCSKCKNYDISISDEPCRKCQQAFRRGEGKPNFIASITNADRIRSMTDEELDKFLGEVQWDVANYCGGITQKLEFPLPEHRWAWLDWLREEASE